MHAHLAPCRGCDVVVQARALQLPYDQSAVGGDGGFSLRAIRRTREDEHRCGDAGMPDHQRLFDREDREHHRAGLDERLRYGFHAVPIRVVLDHRDDLAAPLLLESDEIRGESVEIDVNDGGPQRRRNTQRVRTSRSARGIASTMSVASAPDSPISDASSAPARPCTHTAAAAAASAVRPRAMKAATAPPSASPDPPTPRVGFGASCTYVRFPSLTTVTAPFSTTTAFHDVA